MIRLFLYRIKSWHNSYMKKEFFAIMLCILIPISGSLIKRNVIEIVEVKGNSMLPTLASGTLVCIQKVTKVKRNEIALLQAGENSYIIKRVIGMPGDIIEIESNQLYVNGILFDTKKNSSNDTYHERVVVPDGMIYFLGDNRLCSEDSRKMGCIDIETVVGIAVKLPTYNAN